MLACPECRKLFPNDATECAEHGLALVPLDTLPDEDAPLPSGRMVGEYRIDDKLGAGTFGAVYSGEQPLIGKKVAIKVLHKKFATNSGVVSRFITEARAVNRIRHKNIIDIFSFGLIAEQQPYFVMEMLDGVTLGQLLEKRGRLPVAEALPILRGIAAALDAAHEVGVTHRDLKPDNIFLAAEKDGTFFPKLLDFGVAKLVAEELAHKTATGAAIGTPSYMAPEQCRGRPVDHRADVYALGVVIHEMLTGSRLFEAESGMEVLFMHASVPPKPMSSVLPELPEALDGPVLAMLAKRPDQRPQSAGEAVAVLLQRAVDSGLAEPSPSGPAPAASLERAIVRREAPTRSEHTAQLAARQAPAISASEVTTAKKPLERSNETSGPVVISVDGDAAVVDDMPSAHTMLADSVPTLPTAGTPIGVVAAHPPDPTVSDDTLARAEPAKTVELAAPPRPKRVMPWVIGAAVAAAVGVVAIVKNGAPPAPAPATNTVSAAPVALSAEPPSKVTIRLSVTPSDADLILDGLRIGPASEPLILPRSNQARPLRVEKQGFEAQTIWVLPDRDQEMQAFALRAAPALAPVPTGTPTRPAKPQVHDDLLSPEYRKK